MDMTNQTMKVEIIETDQKVVVKARKEKMR